MAKAGISKRLIKFVDTCVGHKKGGIAIVCVIVACFFGAISGSGPATVAALGAVLIPAMVEQGGFSGKVQVFDFDASPDDIEAIKAGTLTGTVAQYPNLQAESAIQACLDVLDGKTLEDHIVTPAALVTKDNVDKFEAGEDITAQ